MSKKKNGVAYLVNKRTQNVHEINSWACIGRNKTADVCITNPAVSRSHLSLHYNGDTGTWTVTDTGSTLGTKLNNIKLLQDEAMQIKYGDVIRLAELEELTFTFYVGKLPFKRPVSTEKPEVNENMDENTDDRHILHASQDEAMLKLGENENKIKQIEDHFRVQSAHLNNNFASQTLHLSSESEEYKTLKKTYEEEIEKLKSEKEVEIQKLCILNEELQKRLDIEARVIIEQSEKIKQMMENEELAEANLRKLQKENEEKEEELRRLKDQLKRKEQEIEKKNLEKLEELNSLKEDLKLAVSKKEESENIALTAHLNAISNRIESEMLCSICSEIIIDATILNCGHIFCRVCITMWIKKKAEGPICPMCRVPVVSASKCPSITSLLDSVSEELPSLKRKRQELIQERFGMSKVGPHTTAASVENKEPDEAIDAFAFPSNAVLPSGSGQITVTGPVEHIDLTLDDSVLVLETPAPLGRLQNNQQFDLTAVNHDDIVVQHQQQPNTQAPPVQTRRHSLQRNRPVPLQTRLRRNRGRHVVG